MQVRTVLASVGAGVTTFLLGAVLIIEVLPFELSAIIGLPIGIVAGIAAFGWSWIMWDGWSRGVRRAVTAYATFGLSVLALLGLGYVGIGRQVLTVEVVVVASIVVAMLVFAVQLGSDRGIR